MEFREENFTTKAGLPGATIVALATGGRIAFAVDRVSETQVNGVARLVSSWKMKKDPRHFTRGSVLPAEYAEIVGVEGYGLWHIEAVISGQDAEICMNFATLEAVSREFKVIVQNYAGDRTYIIQCETDDEGVLLQELVVPGASSAENLTTAVNAAIQRAVDGPAERLYHGIMTKGA